jgi:hypothetical protein
MRLVGYSVIQSPPRSLLLHRATQVQARTVLERGGRCALRRILDRGNYICTEYEMVQIVRTYEIQGIRAGQIQSGDF